MMKPAVVVAALTALALQGCVGESDWAAIRAWPRPWTSENLKTKRRAFRSLRGITKAEIRERIGAPDSTSTYGDSIPRHLGVPLGTIWFYDINETNDTSLPSSLHFDFEDDTCALVCID